MNTLSKNFTLGTFFEESPERYLELRHRWSEAMRSDDKKTLSFEHHILYLILIGKNWTKSVTEATNQKKLDNGYKSPFIRLAETTGYSYMLRHLVSHKIFNGIITDEVAKKAFYTANILSPENPYKDLSNGIG
jgi:hypothetical protein